MADTSESVVRRVLQNKWPSYLRSEASAESPDSVWKVLLAAEVKNALHSQFLVLIQQPLYIAQGAAV